MQSCHSNLEANTTLALSSSSDNKASAHCQGSILNQRLSSYSWTLVLNFIFTLSLDKPALLLPFFSILKFFSQTQSQQQSCYLVSDLSDGNFLQPGFLGFHHRRPSSTWPVGALPLFSAQPPYPQLFSQMEEKVSREVGCAAGQELDLIGLLAQLDRSRKSQDVSHRVAKGRIHKCKSHRKV